jgi:hypothetical protein
MWLGLSLLLLACTSADRLDQRLYARMTERRPTGAVARPVGADRSEGRPGPAAPSVARIAGHLTGLLPPTTHSLSHLGNVTASDLLPPNRNPPVLQVPADRANRVIDEALGCNWTTGPPAGQLLTCG